MEMAAFGKIVEFQVGSKPVTVYLEKVELYFEVNNVASDKRVAILLSIIGSWTYTLLQSLSFPEPPASKNYTQLKALLTQHYEPKAMVVVERFRFHRRNKLAGKSIALFMAEIRHLSATCSFGGYLNQALWNQLVCGIGSKSIQKRLLAEEEVGLDKAITLALGMDAAERNV